MLKDNGHLSGDIGFGVFLRPDGSVRWPEGWGLEEKRDYVRVSRQVELAASPGEPDEILDMIERALRAEEHSAPSAESTESTG